MAYTVNYSDGTKTAITVANGLVDTTTNLGLVGRGYEGYGEQTAKNFLNLLENFSSSSPPSKPVEGQLWFDNNHRELKYFDNTVGSSGNWKSIASMTVQSSAPTSFGEQDGHFWLDEDSGILYIYYNGSWITVSDVTGNTRIESRTRYDTGDNTHRTVEVIVNGEIVSITSSDSTWSPQNSGSNAEYLEDGSTLLETQFSNIGKGINLNESSGYYFQGTATSALYADLAERYHSDAVYEYGTVVEIGGKYEITQTTTKNSSNVFGVISDNPAFMMNSGAGSRDTHPFVALSGRIPIRVVGSVKKGERLVSSETPGHAMSAGSEYNWEHVIGRALEDKINSEAGIIEAVVGTK